MFCNICAALQPRVLRKRLDRAMGTECLSPVTEPSEALGELVHPLLQLSQSPSQGTPCAKAQSSPSHSHSPSPQMAKRVKGRDRRDIMDLKAQVLELLAQQQTVPVPVPAPVSPKGVQSELQSSARTAEEEDALSIVASWNEDSFPTEMEEGEEPALSTEAEPSSEVASEATAPVFEIHVGPDWTCCKLFAGPLGDSS
ncbi:UNVERIFIED_CONTAM: hypothetical protein FKN15_064884 [Acipenser sinensis]